MFSVFKSKPILKNLIPEGFVDIHSHILYGLDDGATSIKDTFFLIDSMKEFGFKKIITTPHTTPLVWENTKDGILKKLEEVKIEIPDLAKSVSLSAASEYMMDESFLKRLDEEKVLTLKENMVLVEMSYMNPPINLYEIIFKLTSLGYQPVLAHPERYNFYKNDYESFAKLKNAGCLFQLNLLSVTGYYGDKIAEMADYLLKNKMYDFAGSDIHHDNHIHGFSLKIKTKSIKSLEEVMQNNIKVFN